MFCLCSFFPQLGWSKRANKVVYGEILDMESILTNNITLFAITACAFIICYFMIPVIINVSHLKGLFDKPDYRKLHQFATPNLGGVAIFAALLISFSISGYAMVPWAPYLVAGLTILFFAGLKDDILVISANKKLLLQCVAIAIIIGGSSLSINNFGGVFGIDQIPPWAGYAVTFFTMVVVLNAYNLIDGLDGLAGGIGLIASLFFGIWFYQVGMMEHAALALILSATLLAFLCYNFQPASIFMGDTGSQIVGYLLVFFAVVFVQTGITSQQPVPFQNAVPVLVLAVLIVPLYDTIRVFAIRVFKGHSPFKADRRHVHHQLVDFGFSHRASCLIIYGFNLFIIGLTIILADININALFAIVLLTTVILFPTAHFKRGLLIKLGFQVPSPDHISTLEKKIMVVPKSIGFNKKKENPSSKIEEAEEVAV